MKRRRFLEDCKHSIRLIAGLIQVVLLTMIYYQIFATFYRYMSMPRYYGNGKYVLSGLYAVIMIIIMYLCEGFTYGHYKFTDIFTSQCIALFLVDFITYFQLCLIGNRMIMVWPMVMVYFISILVTLVLTSLYTVFFRRFYAPHDILLIYGSEDARNLKFKMQKRADKYKIAEEISISEDTETILSAISRHDTVLVNDVASTERNDILKYCCEQDIRAYVVPKISDLILEGGTDVTLFDTPIKLVQGFGLTFSQRLIKRIMDILLSLIAMILFSPIMLITALAVKLEDGGTIFYKQKRVTRDGRVFEILKFRSMVMDAEKGGYNLSMRANERDPRITKVGRIIRACRVDELPQILNILKGDMSIVGPRPERVENVEAYAREIPEWHLRERVKGGLTGYAQVYGKYNTSSLDKIKLDVSYIANYSLLLDIKLIFLTLRVLSKKESTEGFENNSK